MIRHQDTTVRYPFVRQTVDCEMTQEGESNKKPLRCTFAGGDGRGGFTGEQLRYPCKLRQHICAKCGMHRGEHNRPYAGVRDDLLPRCPRASAARSGCWESASCSASGAGRRRRCRWRRGRCF